MNQAECRSHDYRIR